MECGTEIDFKLTGELESLGFPRRGTLIEYGEQMFHIMGYCCFLWEMCTDVDKDPRDFYDVVLYHVGTGVCSAFPYKKIFQKAIIINKGDDNGKV